MLCKTACLLNVELDDEYFVWSVVFWYLIHGIYIQGVPGGKDNILGGRSIGHSKQETLCERVSYSERCPR
jgi:hypothetical protein